MTALYIAGAVLGYFIIGVCVARATRCPIPALDDSILFGVAWPFFLACASPVALWNGLDWLLFESWRRKASDLPDAKGGTGNG